MEHARPVDRNGLDWVEVLDVETAKQLCNFITACKELNEVSSLLLLLLVVAIDFMSV